MKISNTLQNRGEAQALSGHNSITLTLSDDLMNHLSFVSNEICQPLDLTLKTMIESDKRLDFGSKDERLVSWLECVREVLDIEKEEAVKASGVKALLPPKEDQETAQKKGAFLRDFIHTDALTEEQKVSIMDLAETNGQGIVKAVFSYFNPATPV